MNNQTRSQQTKLAARYWNRAEYYTISENDIDKTTFWFHGPQTFTNVIGRVLPQDVGKRIYKRNGIMQVESKDQFEERISKEQFARVCKSAIGK